MRRKVAGPGERRHCQLLETAKRAKEDSEPYAPEWERNRPASRRARSCQSARRDQRFSIPRHAHAPAPSPSRRWSIRYIAFALVTDGNLGPPLALRFRLRSAVRRCTLISAPLCAALRSSVPLPLADLRPKRSGTNFSDGSGRRGPKESSQRWTSLAG